MQFTLFDAPEPLPSGLPAGLAYEPDFLTEAEESATIALIESLPLTEATYRQYTARRRTVSFGGSYDYDANRLLPTEPLPEALAPLRARVAAWAGIAAETLVHSLVAEYRPGTPLGWHRDVPDFEDVFGVSVGTPAALRFRPYPPVAPKKADIVRLNVMPRSIYRMSGTARWDWQHSVAPTEALRWSITFRTRAAGFRRP